MKAIKNIVIVGFGSIAQALMPLLTERYNANITIFEKDVDSSKEKIAKEFNASIIQKTITPNNFEITIGPHLNQATFSLEFSGFSIQ